MRGRKGKGEIPGYTITFYFMAFLKPIMYVLQHENLMINIKKNVMGGIYRKKMLILKIRGIS